MLQTKMYHDCVKKSQQQQQNQHKTQTQPITLEAASKCCLRDHKNIKPNPAESVICKIIIAAEGTLMAFSTFNSLECKQ